MTAFFNAILVAINEIINWFSNLWDNLYKFAVEVFDQVLNGVDWVVAQMASVFAVTDPAFSMQTYVDLLPTNTIALLNAMQADIAFGIIATAFGIRLAREALLAVVG